MAKPELSKRLNALATSDSERSETARLRDVIDDVEAALAAGVSHAKIVQELQADGFKMDVPSFRSALFRIRKRRGKTGTTTRQESATAATSSRHLEHGPTTKPSAPGTFEFDPSKKSEATEDW